VKTINDAQAALAFTWHEALGEDIRALGGRKAVAPKLWPGEDEETANNRLKAAMAPGHSQELKPSEVLRIKEWARDVGSYALVNFEAQLLSFRVEWIEPENEAEMIRREVRDLMLAANQKLDRLEQTEKRVAMRGGRR
jgi:hypothetical protein